MNPADLAQALPGLLLAAMAPGIGLAALIAPRWRPWEWLVVSAGLSAGFLETLGLAFHQLHVSFEPATVYPVAVMVGGLGFLRWMLARRHSLGRVSEISRRRSLAVAVSGLLAGVGSAAALVYSLRDQVLPLEVEPAQHGAGVRAIVQAHDVLAPSLHPHLAFEATGAMVSMTFGPSPAVAMMPVVLLALVLLPLGLAMLALEVTRSPWVAALTPLLSTGMAFPSFQLELGRFPEILAATLVAGALVAIARLLRGRDRIAHALMLAVISAAVWVTLRPESFTAPGLPTGLLAPGNTTHPHPRVVFEIFAQTDLSSPIALGLLGLGLVAALARRQLLWVLAAYVLLLLAVADSLHTHLFNWGAVRPWVEPDRLLGLAYWVVPLLMAFGLVSGLSLAIQVARFARTWGTITLAAMAAIAGVVLVWPSLDRAWGWVFREDVSPYPWLPMSQLTGLSRWIAPIVLATFILGGTWITLRFLYLTEPGGRRRAMASRTTAAVVSSLAIGLLSLGLGLRQENSTYDHATGPRHLVTAADLAVMESISQSLPARSKVLITGSDGGIWVAAVANDKTVVSRALAAAVAKACSDPAAAARALASVDVVFIGAHPLGGAHQTWDAGCLASVPGLNEIGNVSSAEGTAHAFIVVRPAGKPPLAIIPTDSRRYWRSL
jgi:hypothetical protein